MQRDRSIRWPLGLTLALLTFSSTARARENVLSTSTGTATMSTLIDGDYGYRFTDDVMQAGAFTPADARLIIAAHVNRSQLIRPRTAFVVELLKSVENL